MCGRYELHELWTEYVQWMDINRAEWDLSFKAGEVCPRDRMPIVRRDADGSLIAEPRHWGFILMVDGKSIDRATGKPKKIRRDVINAMSEKLTSNHLWKWSFAERRCLIPMSSWDEWPETGAGKQRVRVSMPGEPVFMAAGLYDESVDPKTGARMPVYTMCTVPPNEFLGTVHDRAPMVLLPSQYDGWLDGGAGALRLVGTHPDAAAFAVRPV